MRVIPIAAPNFADSACHEGSGEVPKLKLALARREFLKGSGVLMGSIAAGSALAALAPSSAWAVELIPISVQDETKYGMLSVVTDDWRNAWQDLDR